MELKKIKLNKLSDDALAQRQLKGLKGGSPCCAAVATMNTVEGHLLMIMEV